MWGSKKDAKKIKVAVKKGPEPEELEGLSLIEIAETLETEGCGKLDEAKKLYVAITGEQPKARWARVDVVIGAVAGIVDPQ